MVFFHPTISYPCPINFNMKKRIFILSLIAIIFMAPHAHAIEPTPAGCQPIYNGGSICANNGDITINKKVLKPGVNITPGYTFKDSDFIENIGPNDPGYPLNTLTAFRIYVTNKGRSTVKNIVLKDILPPRYVTFISGSGTYDATNRTFSTTIKELKSKETQAVTVQVMTARDNEVPKDGTSLCTINLASVTANNKTSQDTSQLCVSTDANVSSQKQSIAFPQMTKGITAPTPQTQATKQVKPEATTKGGLVVASPAAPEAGQKTPPTGPEALVLAGLLPLGALGVILRKKSLSS